jgi:hypothetical protein
MYTHCGVLYFGLFNPSNTLPYPFTSFPRFSTVFNTHPYILYVTSYGMRYY